MKEEIQPNKIKKWYYMTKFQIKLILKNIQNKKRNSIIIAFGIIFSLTTLFTATIWINTSQILITDKYIEQLDYEMYINTYMPYTMTDVYEYVINDPLVEKANYIYTSEALFNFEDKKENYRFFPEDQQENMTNPISITSAILLSSTSLDRIQLNFEIIGKFNLKPGNVMISEFQAKELEKIYNTTISPGYNLTIGITKRIPYTDGGEVYLRYFDLNVYQNVTVSAIFDFKGTRTILDKLLGGGEVSEGIIEDSIIFPIEEFNNSDFYTLERNGLLPRLLVKSKAEKLRESGITEMADTLSALKDRIKSRFYFSNCILMDNEIEAMTDEYERIANSLVLFVPTIVAAAVLTILSSHITTKQRREEIAMLRAKGAISIQLISIFFGEFIIIGIISWFISLGLGILTAGLLPAVSGSETFDQEKFIEFYQYIDIPAFEMEIISIVVLGLYFISTFLQLYNFIKKDIRETFLISKRGKKIISSSIIVMFFSLAVIGFIFQVVDFLEYQQTHVFTSDIKRKSIFTFIFLLGLMFFIAYITSIILNRLLPKLKKVYEFLFKETSFFIHKNIKRKERSFKDLSLFILIIISFLTYVTTIQSTIIFNQQLEHEYLQGADIRVHTESSNITYFEEKLESITGIEKAMGFYQFEAKIGSRPLELFGVDPIKYEKIGRWRENSFINTTSKEALEKLDSDIRGVIISDYLIDRLGYEIDESIYLSDFVDGPSFVSFNLSAASISAPGLGLAHGKNPKIDRYIDEFVILNKEILRDVLEVKNGTLFLASLEKGANPDEIKSELLKFEEIKTVNPERINPAFIGYFILQFIPDVWIILLIAAIFIGIIGIIYIFISFEYIALQRRREYALLLALGAKPRKVGKIILSEIVIFIISIAILGIPIGIFESFLTLLFIKPLILNQEIVNLALHVKGYYIISIIGVVLLSSLLSALPLVKKQTRDDVIRELRALV